MKRNKKNVLFTLIAIVAILCSQTSHAQDAVVAASNADALFTSSVAKLHANKQVAYHIVKDLLESGHWELADKYISEGYIQHNPNAANGRAAVVKFFTEILKVKPKPIPAKMASKIVSVTAEGDLVVVAYVKDEKNAKTGKAYTTTWFDQWRIVDGKATEHWDGATLMQ